MASCITVAIGSWNRPASPACILNVAKQESEDVAGTVLLLCSGAASWITGQALPIDGGFTIAG